MNSAHWFSHAQCTKFVDLEGESVSFLFMGTPGIGKSSILSSFMQLEHRRHYTPIMIDCARMQAGEVAMPVIDPVTKQYSWALSEDFLFGNTTPVIICLDELGKANEGVINDLLPLVMEHRIGKSKLPKGSIVFSTTNLVTDGVGDRIPPHLYNRMATIQMRGPNPAEWAVWASGAGVASEVIALTQIMPQCLQEYTQLAMIGGTVREENKFIFDPKRGQKTAFSSARSLAMLSRPTELYKTGQYNETELEGRVAGSVGDALASHYVSLLSLGVKLPTGQDVLTNGDAAAQRLRESRTGVVLAVSAHYLVATSLASFVRQQKTGQVLEAISKWVDTHLMEEAAVLYTMMVTNSAHMLMTTLKSPVFQGMVRKFNAQINGVV